MLKKISVGTEEVGYRYKIGKRGIGPLNCAAQKHQKVEFSNSWINVTFNHKCKKKNQSNSGWCEIGKH